MRHCEERPRVAVAVAQANCASNYRMHKSVNADCFVVPPRKDVLYLLLLRHSLFAIHN